MTFSRIFFRTICWLESQLRKWHAFISVEPWQSEKFVCMLVEDAFSGTQICHIFREFMIKRKKMVTQTCLVLNFFDKIKPWLHMYAYMYSHSQSKHTPNFLIFAYSKTEIVSLFQNPSLITVNYIYWDFT